VELARTKAKPVAELEKNSCGSASRAWGLARTEIDEAGSETRLTGGEKKELTRLRRDSGGWRRRMRS
jgi:hypothetical protein